MAKTLSQFMTEVAQPKSEDEKAFKDKHIVAKHADANGNGDDVFKAEKIKKDATKKASHHKPQDEEVYESFEVDLLKELLEAAEEDVATYVEMYQSTMESLSDENKERLVEMVRQGDVDKIVYFLEAVNY